MFKEMVDSGYFQFMAEAEGLDSLITTRTAKINAAIKDFKKIRNNYEDPNDYIDEVLYAHGLTESELTDAECERMNRAINGY